MYSKLCLAALFSAVFVGATFPMAQTQAPAATPQEAAPKPAPADTPASTPAQTPVASDTKPQGVPEKPATPKKKVYTNDNLPKGAPGDFSGMDFSEINNCDRNCFEQVRQLAHINTSANPNWKRDQLRALDTVRTDAQWQQYLRDLFDMHLRFCALGAEKRDELAKVADPNNVTPRELAVDDKYDAKFKQAQASLEVLTSRQRGLQQTFAINPSSLQFSQLQVSRIQNAPCSAQRYVAGNPADADDP